MQEVAIRVNAHPYLIIVPVRLLERRGLFRIDREHPSFPYILGKGQTAIIIAQESRISRLKEGEMPIFEPGLDDLVERNSAAGRRKRRSSSQELHGVPASWKRQPALISLSS
jgi:hypothetical protein